MSFYPTVYFVFPYRGVGGVPVLFYRVASYLAANNLAKPILVDYEDGAMVKLAQNERSNVKIALYPEDGYLEIPGDAYAVFQSMTPWSLFPNIRLHPETRLLFWNCHPYNLVLFIPGFRFFTYRFKRVNRIIGDTLLRSYSRQLKSFINTIQRRHGLLFMDEENRKNTESYNRINLQNVELLPIPVEVEEERRTSNFREESDRIHITWIGRLVDFKFYPLKHLLASMELYARKQSILFECSIIGSGPYLEVLQKFVSRLSCVKVRLLGDMGLSEVRMFIDAETDIVAAMGTSALEGGSREVPTILLDLSYKDIPGNYRFKWLFETTGCNLAEEVSTRHLTNDDDSFSRLMARYKEDPVKVGKLCSEYIKSRHTLDVVSRKLVTSLKFSELQGKDVEELVGHSNGTLTKKTYSIFRKFCTRIQGS